METKELVEKLLKMAEDNEWQIHHAAENQYCPYCINYETQSWDDMRSHNDGCEYVALVAAAKEWLSNNA